jgi:hypothetical protein
MSRAIISAGKGSVPEKIWVLASAANLLARTWSMGSRNLTSRAAALSSAARAGFAGGLTLGVEEGVGHGTTDQDRIDLVEQGVDDSDLVGDLGAADDGDEGAVGLGDGFAEVGELLFHEQAGGRLGDEVGDAFGGGVGAVGCAEGVVHVDVAESSELLGEGWVVGFFFWVEAEVFKQQGLARLEVAGQLDGHGADAVGGEGDVFVGVKDVVEEHTQPRGDGLEAHGVDVLALRPPKVRGENDLGLAAERVLDSGDGLADASVVGDGAIFGERHVEVDTDEDTLAGEIEVANG